jgi:hypothetical protein
MTVKLFAKFPSGFVQFDSTPSIDGDAAIDAAITYLTQKFDDGICDIIAVDLSTGILYELVDDMVGISWVPATLV